MDTTDRLTERAIVGVRRIDEATVAEAQAVRRSRPIAAVVVEVENAIAVVATSRSRIPDSMIWAKLAGEVHAFIGAVVQ